MNDIARKPAFCQNEFAIQNEYVNKELSAVSVQHRPYWGGSGAALPARHRLVMTFPSPPNYNRAQTDVYFGQTTERGALGKFRHGHELAAINCQPGHHVSPIVTRCIRSLCSTSTPCPVKVTLPDAGKRFMVMQVVNEDQYTPAVLLWCGKHTLRKEGIGTRYGILWCAWWSIQQILKMSTGPRLAGCAHGEPAKSRHIRNPQLG